MRRLYWEWPIAIYLFLGGMGGGMSGGRSGGMSGGMSGGHPGGGMR